MDHFLKEYRVFIDQNLAWGEMDSFKHINNTVYFRYFENARLEYFQKINLFPIMQQTGIGLVLASTQCRFRIPLEYPDKITIGTKVFEIGNDYFMMKYEIYSHKISKVVAEGDARIVSYSFQEKKKISHPSELKNNILALEGEGILKL
jgi:acyl-CoA thioester hydrolase